ncbi:uncharacterized protein CTRU02_209767 [Colletotrichum truncatum]|uniref:Uncharacterized protein n=1 Tax=Colletotrichum truncatum TaxID=5467 RepID=A0ACC3YTD3_COLTU|nr:uncharacterized protein CTRU02_02340 [Colletotrichum truncatum]KAF6798366.1 hypothetical protein CTRU02_02340 [Colletotrichum truncatum]
MQEAQELPMPASGDIFTVRGKLTVTNAAANIFIIHDRSFVEDSSSPSSFSVEFVMGNVYHIDSSLLSPSRWGNTKVHGNLVKGLGLQTDGLKMGDVCIHTVYDDIVCLIANQLGAGCTIGSVAGNLVTVSDLALDDELTLPENITVAYFAGLRLRETHLAHGGGLQRAYSAWTSMKFLPFRQQHTSGNSETLPHGYIHHLTENEDLPAMLSHPKTSQPISSQMGATRQLQQAISERDHALKELSILRQQTLTRVEGPQTCATHDSDSHDIVCGNCARFGHQVKDCIGPIDDNGFIAACPVCNTKAHEFDQCLQLKANSTSKRKRLDMRYHYLVTQRAKKAPIKTSICWISVWVTKGMPMRLLPITRQFALKLAREDVSVPYPAWQTYNYDGAINDYQNDLPQDPETVLEPGKVCQLVPGSQCTNTGATYSKIKRKLQKATVGKGSTKSRSSTKSKKKLKRMRHHALHLLADEPKGMAQEEVAAIRGQVTGANSIIIQHPLPSLISSGRTETVEVKKEPSN